MNTFKLRHRKPLLLNLIDSTKHFRPYQTIQEKIVRPPLPPLHVLKAVATPKSSISLSSKHTLTLTTPIKEQLYNDDEMTQSKSASLLIETDLNEETEESPQILPVINEDEVFANNNRRSLSSPKGINFNVNKVIDVDRRRADIVNGRVLVHKAAPNDVVFKLSDSE